MTIRRMLIACCLPKSTYTHSQDMQFLFFSTETMIEKKAPECYIVPIFLSSLYMNSFKIQRQNARQSVIICNMLID